MIKKIIKLAVFLFILITVIIYSEQKESDGYIIGICPEYKLNKYETTTLDSKDPGYIYVEIVSGKDTLHCLIHEKYYENIISNNHSKCKFTCEGENKEFKKIL